ncbi:nitroreductase [Phytopseudomonas dryadis]|uniref:Nitroreductase family protein n=1 Tax=Phytopseudomonas dryadis TaxID=2487520 RepID=A0A4Q9QX09_9GAMM|nr:MULTISPECIES: nitroreductase [Pseudomonas]TBU89042.1 nitroreductase family protein [Pseudomonas dryadis]TBV08356.1 nitroreductase family protein [Pseudomonas dryadis]TBV19642.1 nitroreductase family protein [Pseudomonas sp. FRB 230]
MKVSEALRERHSTRAFLDKAVDAQLLRSLLRQAARAPSSGNLQPWRIQVVQGTAMTRFREHIAERLARDPEVDPPDYPVYPQPLQEPYRSSRFEVGEQMYRLLDIGRADKAGRLAWFARNYRFFEAPCAAFFFVERCMGPGQWADLGMYQQSLMLLLKEHGLDSCAQACWARYHLSVEAFLQVPDSHVLHCAIAIGHADPEAPVNRLVSERLPLEAFCTFVE